jgi:hypothetical protein
VAYKAKVRGEDREVNIVDKRTVGELTILIDEDGDRWTPAAFGADVFPAGEADPSVGVNPDLNDGTEVRAIQEGEDPDGDAEGVPPPADSEAVTGAEADEVRGKKVGLDRAGEGEPDPTATEAPGGKKGK